MSRPTSRWYSSAKNSRCATFSSGVGLVSIGRPSCTLGTPYTSVVIKLGQQLRPATEYRLAARAIKSLAGRLDDSDRRFTTPKPPPPKPAADTTAAKAPSATASW